MNQQQHSSVTINVKKAFIIVSICIISMLQLCHVELSQHFKKRKMGEEQGIRALTCGGYISEEEWGYLPVSAEMKRALVCVSPSGY